MATKTVSTTVTELPESRVRVDAEVTPEEIEKRVQQAARAIGRDIRIDGFRKGKVPPVVIIRRLGRAAVLDDAVRDSMGTWYAAAIGESGIHPIGDPELDFSDLPEEGQPLKFSIEIGVRPTAKLGDYKGLEIGKREPTVEDAEIDKEIDQLRERMARLETVDRTAAQGDFVVMDFVGSIDGVNFPGGEGRDQMVELGSGKLVPGFEDQLQGAVAGESRTVKIDFPEDYGSEELAGKAAQFAVDVKEIKEKQLPELNDEFAEDTAGFETLDELREDIKTRMAEHQEQQLTRDFSDVVLKQAIANAEIELPDALIEARAHELWHDMQHSLEHQGINKELFLQISGKTEEAIIDDAKPDARNALEREAVLAAIVAAEGIQVSDDELLDAVVSPEERPRVKKPEKLLARLREAGRLEGVKDDLAARKAADLLVEAATAITVEQAKERNLLYTPEKGEEADPAPDA